MATLWAFSGMKPVDFIERFFGIAPDHHDGSLEAMLLIMLVIAVTGLGLTYFRKHQMRE
jgi:hypothetical protein